MQATERKLYIVSLWDSLALKFFFVDMEALGSESGGKLAIYRCLKDLPAAELYARANLPVSIRRVLAGLRAGCLRLQVELGRYSSPKTPFNERLCKMCNLEVEDQEHFLLHCPSLRLPRATLWAEISKHNPDFISYDSNAKLLVTYLLCPTELIFIIAKGIHKVIHAQVHPFILFTLIFLT